MQSLVRFLASKTLLGLSLLGALAAVSCGHTNYNSGYGTAWVTYSATPGSFPSYTIVVDSVTLTRSDGAVVSGVSAAETVDFSKLTDTAEMVSSTLVPIGTYTSATVNLNFTSAAIFVDNAGSPQLATVVDRTGAAVTTLAVTVTFDPASPLVIAQSQAQRLNLNLDLGASNSINSATTPATVTVNPFISVSNSPANNLPIRVRGPLISYDTQLNTYTVYVRPFNDEVNNLGTLTLFPTATTTFAIDEENFLGAAGVRTLSNIETGTITSATTSFAPDAKAGTFTPSQVYVATATESLVADRIQGTVVSRAGNSLTVVGATYLNRNGTLAYEPLDATLLVGSGTYVGQDGFPNAANLSAASVSVGQEITAFGQASAAASGALILDATAGHVRLGPTRVWGTLSAAAAGAATLNLNAIGQWPLPIFSFAGTGVTSAQDAVPAAYSLSTGSSNYSAAIGMPVAADGFVTAFGAAPPDFAATALTPTAGLIALLQINWINGGSSAPFSTASSASLVADLSSANLGAVHAISYGPFSLDLSSLPSSPSIVGIATQKGEFAIGNATSGTTNYSSFASFVAQIESTIAAGTAIASLTATGYYNAATNTFTAVTIDVSHE